ncbi:MAG: DNA repair protein RecO [Gammaproteobacteria bacterium]|nr:DNA repair protein RecO [Gammaproteobacteria bacterium]NNF48891.1 DNA repair protein RecO [Woeseiaceae bacterium]MBT8095014.1 DNA repair protein RecO [Gammaproteobacteria bacterium]MBT8104684.1 DNA repair protein RecO [Gammaproteobacteria bacterium]NNK24698.1 DNA repair protein RecO [Woeseiaceae bacterium]
MSTRVQQQPGYVLHHRPFRDSSRILDVLTRDHGKIAVVARGSRGSKSRLAGVLRPFLPLRVSWVAKSDLGTLTGAEATGRPADLRGDALLSAYYVNELILHFLHRHDAQPEVFALYADVIPALVSGDAAPALRNFELEFLGLLGYAVNLEHEASSHDGVEASRYYDYRVEQGPVPVSRSEGPLVFRGMTLHAIAARRFDDADVLSAAGRLLRAVMRHHLGGRELQSRKVLREIHRGRIAPPEGPERGE